MLTPMMVQYLVGLCCLRHEPDAVEITLGDMIYDEAAQKSRDVDVTITFKDADGTLTAFKVAEVKKEAQPLDVVTIEQLCLKFMDMPQITHRSIFSTSGYTEAAKRKAKYHSVELYTLKPWNRRIENDFPDFKGVGTPQEFWDRVDACILRWVKHSVFLVVPNGPDSFHWTADTSVFSFDGKVHSKYKNIGEYVDVIIRRSADALCTLEPIMVWAKKLIDASHTTYSDFAVGPVMNHSHTMDVGSDSVYLKFDNCLHQITSLTITGQLQWSIKKRNPEFYILENVETKEIFAGAAIADYGEDDGRMFAMIFPEKGRELGIHRFCISDKQKNIIHQLKLKS